MFRSLQFTILTVLLSITCSITAQNPNFTTSLSVPANQFSQTCQSSSGNRSGNVIYSQITPVANGSIACHKITEPGWTHMSCTAADDFIVPDGETWPIHVIELLGTYGGNNPDSLILNFNVRFFNDDQGKPGAQLYAFNNLLTFIEMPYSSMFTKMYEITLPQIAEFSAGHYWMEIQPTLYSEQWYWTKYGTETVGNEYHWKNPANGFGLGYTNWTPASIFSPQGSYNLSFRLYAPGMANDVRSAGIIDPVHSPYLTNQELVTIKIKNESAFPVSGFNVGYCVDNGPVTIENVDTLSIAGNQFGNYTFNATANLSEDGAHQFKSWTCSPIDPNHVNDTTVTTIYNMGTVYPMNTSGTETLHICNATFTDAGGFGFESFSIDSATTVIYPLHEGDRIVLEFLEWDLTGQSFMIYNGPDQSSPLLFAPWNNNVPGTIIALNPSGALTIFFDGFVNMYHTGWVAFVKCITPQNNEFSVNTLETTTLSVFEDDTVTFTASVHNIGTASHEKLVTFKANGNIIGTDYTGFVAPYDTAFISLNWVVPDEGTYTIEVSIEDDYDNSNNLKAINISAIDLDVPYTLIASGDSTEINLTWQNPDRENLTNICYDSDETDEYFGSNMTNQWFGNYFEISEPTTVLNFDMAVYPWMNSGDIRLMGFDIMNSDGEIIYRTHDFIKRDATWYTVEIPDMTIESDFYAMMHYDIFVNASYRLAFDNDTVPGHGYLKYAGQGFGQMMGSFLIRANVLTGVSNGENSNYNIRLGTIEDIKNAEDWTILNTSPISETQYTDQTWPPSEMGKYIYAVSLTDPTGESGFSFSNILSWDPVNVTNHSIPGISLYPNPAKGTITIETPDASEILLFNMQGKMMFSDKINGSSYKLSTSAYPAGSYLIVLKTHQGISQQKIIIMNDE